MLKKYFFILLFFVALLPGDLLAQCVSSIALSTEKAGVWDSSCLSEHQPGGYAKYYTFTLSSSREVTIDLESSVDTLLYLLSGSLPTGAVIAQDDDGGTGTNSKIVKTLAAGTYTVEATTFSDATTGAFVVSVDAGLAPPDACSQTISSNTEQEGVWIKSCLSVHRVGSYAKYYTFTLPGSREVTIDLESLGDPYLYLLAGSGSSGQILSQDDDSGPGDDSRIVRVLPAGTYTIEATTYEADITDSFVLTVSSVCDDCLFEINAGLNDAWFDIATSGQGFTFVVFPAKQEMWVAWFTYDTERPPADVTANLGGPGQRWLTAQGPYDGDTATLTIYVTEGGVFDSTRPVPTTDQDGDGTLTIEFAGCNEAIATYEITSLDISGEIPLERTALDNVPLCEMLSNP